MTRRTVHELAKLTKAPTGVPGLDSMLHGGIPRGRISLVQGDSGAGKSVLALQSLVHGAGALDEPGIFVAFEEQSGRILENASSFDWNIAALAGKQLHFLDAQPPAEALHAGNFDLTGMLVALDALVRKVGAQRIVFDALDVVLTMLDDGAAERRELYRLRDWIYARKITALLTSKSSDTGVANQRTEFIQFMVDCGLTLGHRIEHGVSQRSVRVTKYRGTSYRENECPYVIGRAGIEVSALLDRQQSTAKISSQRLSSGAERLDKMLGGGYYRGAGVLLTGAPGTAKSTLASAFSEAACLRGERTLFISFDTGVPEMVRNMKSVGIRLDQHLHDGPGTARLRMELAQSFLGSAESQLFTIQAQAAEHRATCLVIDPISALTRGGSDDLVHSVVSRLIDWSKFNGTTLLCTSLLGEVPADVESSPLRISTLADTWIHVSYIINGGERNRALTVVKSRGTSHSNQVRELILSKDGLTLADTYSAQGEVLMGTLRWEREQAESAAQERLDREQKVTFKRLIAEQEDLSAQMTALRSVIDAKAAELEQLRDTQARRQADRARHKSDVRKRRSADAVSTKPKSPTTP